MSEAKKKLVVAFIDFLKTEIKSGQLGEEAVEGLEGMYVLRLYLKINSNQYTVFDNS